MKRSSLFSLLCAFVPGAGEMYMGLMNRGVSIMLLFWGTVAFCTISGLEFFLFLCPVIWFYSFFETLNLRKMTYEQLCALPDDMILGGDFEPLLNLFRKRQVLAGGLCIAVGVYILYDGFLLRHFSRYLWETFPFLMDLLQALPTLLVAFAIIFLGIHLIRGKNPLPYDDDFTEYKGGSHLPEDPDTEEENHHES